MPLLFRNKDTFVDNLRRIFRKENITWDGTTDVATTPSDATLLCTRSHTIDQVLLPMMKESNNSMAEALFYQIAAQGGRKGAGRKQAVVHYNDLIRRRHLSPPRPFAAHCRPRRIAAQTPTWLFGCWQRTC